MSDYILKTIRLTKSFKDQVAVKDVSLSIRKNSIFGLLGPNGAGKSKIVEIDHVLQGIDKMKTALKASLEERWLAEQRKQKQICTN